MTTGAQGNAYRWNPIQRKTRWYDPRDESHRFNLLFKENLTNNIEQSLSEIRVFSFNQTIYIQTPKDGSGQIRVFDLLGKQVARKKLDVSATTVLRIDSSFGYFLVQVQVSGELVTKKVYLK